MDPGPLSHTAPHAHDARPLDLTLRVVRFSAPCTHPAHPDYPSFPNGQKPAQSRSTCSDAPATHMQCVLRNTRHRCYSPGDMKPQRSTARQNYFSRILRHPWLEMVYSYPPRPIGQLKGIINKIEIYISTLCCKASMYSTSTY